MDTQHDSGNEVARHLSWLLSIVTGIVQHVVAVPARWLEAFDETQDALWEPFLVDDDATVGLPT